MVTPQSVARGWMHDAMCASQGCPPGDSDHAKRTQATFGRDAVRAWKAGESLAGLLHDKACPCLGRVEGDERVRHLTLFENAATDLAAALSARRVGPPTHREEAAHA